MTISEGSSSGTCANNDGGDNDKDDKYNKNNIFLYGFTVQNASQTFFHLLLTIICEADILRDNWEFMN